MFPLMFFVKFHVCLLIRMCVWMNVDRKVIIKFNIMNCKKSKQLQIIRLNFTSLWSFHPLLCFVSLIQIQQMHHVKNKLIFGKWFFIWKHTRYHLEIIYSHYNSMSIRKFLEIIVVCRLIYSNVLVFDSFVIHVMTIHVNVKGLPELHYTFKEG